MQRLYQEYGDRAAFLFVYVREAHPSDEWQMEPNVKDGVVFTQPKDLNQRRDIAQTCCKSLAITMPCVVDSIDNQVDEMYAGWPERLFAIDEQGRIAYAGGQGPFGFDPEGLEAWLKNRFGQKAKARS